MRIFRRIALILGMVCVTGVVGVTGCVSPIYDTARTQKGLTIGGGLAYHDAYHDEGNYAVEFSGIRPDISVGYGFTNWFSVVGRGGLLFDFEDPNQSLPFLGAGLKFSTPWDRLNLSSRVEFDLPKGLLNPLLGLSFTPMAGLSNKNGHEYLTFGLQTIFGIVPVTAFVNLHPFQGTHVFLGAAGPSEGTIPEVCLGLGYTHTFDFKKSEE